MCNASAWATEMARSAVAVRPAVSVARTRKFDVPGTTGVPEITPEGARVSSAGRGPTRQEPSIPTDPANGLQRLTVTQALDGLREGGRLDGDRSDGIDGVAAARDDDEHAEKPNQCVEDACMR